MGNFIFDDSQRRISTRSAQYVFAGLFLAIAIQLFLYQSSNVTPDLVYNPAFVESVQADNPPVVVTEWIPELPVRLVIPSIEVDALIQSVGVTDNGSGEMEVPSNFTDVAWYKLGVRPGMRGSAVMTGHYNGVNTKEAVFYRLDELMIGDEVVVMSEERIEDIFSVVKIKVYDYSDSTEEVFISSDGKARLNLITCTGNWLPELLVYDKRIVVFTQRLTDVE